MPKTRSGKIMRRILSAISNNRDVGDTTTLANPDIVTEIQKMSQEMIDDLKKSKKELMK
jgi:acetyl-CoA synthetase